MRVKISYFAAFRDLTGIAEENVDTSATTTGELFEEAMQRHAGLVREPAALVAVNDEMSDWSTPLSEGDEVLFFPPVAGG